jgi:hypothetical protein
MLPGLMSRWMMRRLRRRQRTGDLDGILQSLRYRQAACRNQLLERPAGNKLHHDEVSSVHPVDLMDGDDVGVVQRGRRLGCLSEALFARFVFQLLGAEHLDADETVEAQITRLVGHTHAAFAEFGEYFVVG